MKIIKNCIHIFIIISFIFGQNSFALEAETKGETFAVPSEQDNQAPEALSDLVTSQEESAPEEIFDEMSQAQESDEDVEPVAPASSSGSDDTGTEDSKKVELKPEISTNQGSLIYSYPIFTPEGRNGMTPQISLSYNSSDTSINNIIAKGWSLNIPNITRKNKTGTNNLYTDDNFVSSFDGELVHQGGSTYVPRVENGSFIKYEFNNNIWRLTDKSGMVYILGQDPSSRQDNPSNQNQIYTWYLSSQIDKNENRILYSYFKDQGQVYPKSVVYNQDELFQIHFERTSKQHQTTSYKSAFKVNTNFEISAISVDFKGDPIRHYELEKENNTLIKIKERAFADGQEMEIPEVVFEYGISNSKGWDKDEYTEFISSYKNKNVGFIDVDGDGLLDMLDSRRSGNSSTSTYVRLNNGNGFTYSTEWSAGVPLREENDTNFRIYTYDSYGTHKP